MSNLQVLDKFRVFSPYSELRALLSVFPDSRIGASSAARGIG